jgi:acetoin utilization protein AcuB
VVLPHAPAGTAKPPSAHGTYVALPRIAMLMPAVSHHMTRQPWTIERTATLAEAHRLMCEHEIRHLPVVEAGTVVGIVTRHDLDTLAGGKLSLDQATVADAMKEHPFVVTGDTALEEVVDIMADRKYSSVIVAGRDGIEGIFTAVDACRVLADVLRRAEAA